MLEYVLQFLFLSYLVRKTCDILYTSYLKCVLQCVHFGCQNTLNSLLLENNLSITEMLYNYCSAVYTYYRLQLFLLRLSLAQVAREHNKYNWSCSNDGGGGGIADVVSVVQCVFNSCVFDVVYRTDVVSATSSLSLSPSLDCSLSSLLIRFIRLMKANRFEDKKHGLKTILFYL